MDALRKEYAQVGDRLEQEQNLVLQLRWVERNSRTWCCS
jgi:hypothetical protein